MSDSSPEGNAYAAMLLEQGAAGFAGFAANRLLEKAPGLADRYAPSAHRAWKTNLKQRVLELAAAVQTGEAKLFVSQVSWARASFEFREKGYEDLRLSLTALYEVLEENLPGPALELPLQILAAGQEALSKGDEGEGSVGLDAEDVFQRHSLVYLKTLLEGQPRQAIDDVIALLDDDVSPLDLYLEVLMPAQREIGRLWHRGEVNIAEEHLVTSTTQRALGVLVHAAPTAEPNGKTVVAAAVAGDDHDMGLRAAADAFQLAGWRTLFLGRNMPAHDLVQSLEFFQADLLLLTATLSTQIPRVRETVEAVRQHSGERVKILVGGTTFDESVDLGRKLGADAQAVDIRGALAIGARLVGLG